MIDRMAMAATRNCYRIAHRLSGSVQRVRDWGEVG
jgi:hypothetical protein